ncbi:uncharacterized protein HKW66_Vig0132610 [Vigna angularis]|uniref:Nudix hydrolase domain-containing protein n=1 Tax=Phaseolus angularis TaxID=3914 RepID=A0A8T0K1W6_PHAAN|nr:uncharacterized protein HKW66_Vig0132610 [Vigna angularis]
MSLTATPSKNTTTATTLNTLPSSPHNFASPQSLSDWLKPRLPSESFALLGVKPGTKNVHNLWLKLSQGETSLVDSSPLIRTVHVVLVCVTAKHGKVLVESHQDLSDGNIRKRSRPFSEKMKPNEYPESVAVRGIFEELSFVIVGAGPNPEIADNVTIDPNSYEMWVEERDSSSYLGFPGWVFCCFLLECQLLHFVQMNSEIGVVIK